MAFNSGSFRDPSGQVFSRHGKIYRAIFDPGVKDFEAARDAGIYDKLIGAGLLLPHEEVGEYDLAPRGTVYCLKHPKLPTDYGEIRTYGKEDLKKKSEYVAKAMQRLKPNMVWDLGANTGEFSVIAASHGAFVVSIDGDPACTEYLYQSESKKNEAIRILPLTMDLANPSPGLGWSSSERLSLHERGPADLVLALALIHHLVFSSCVPLPLIAEWFGSLTNHLLVEFVPPTDLMVQKLLRNRGDEHLPYNLEVFNSSFAKIFELLDQTILENGRTLFLYKRR